MSEDRPPYGTAPPAPPITPDATIARLRRELASAHAAGDAELAQALALAVEILCERYGIG